MDFCAIINPTTRQHLERQNQYSSPPMLQPSILRPPLIIRPLDLVPRANFIGEMTFILRPPAI